MNNEKNEMKKSLFVILSLVVMTMCWTTGCTDKKAEPNDSIIDSLDTDTMEQDTLESLIEETPMPKAADELFDDFLFNFAANKKLQYERIDFPLQMSQFGKIATVNKKQWKMERFFMRQGYFTLVVGSAKELENSKSTDVEHVVIEKIFLKDNYVQQYVFNRVEGLWKMQQVNRESIAKNQNGDFYAFYDKFVNDSTYRQQSLAETVDFSGPDPDDDFSRMEGSIMPEQWEMFAPELPKDMIYNIVYGDKPIKGNTRIFVVRGIANGLETELTFRKTKGGFILEKINT